METLKQTAPVVQDFAEWLVSQGSLKDHQLFFVGRSMDLPYHATAAIAQQRRRDAWIKPEDVYLIDFSRGKFNGGFPQWKNHARIRRYLESCDLNLQRPIAIVDDIYLHGTTMEALRNVLLSTRRDTKTVVIYDDDPMREDGARPSLAYARRRPAPYHDIRGIAACLGNRHALIPSFDASATRSAAMALSADSRMGENVYDPARSYEVATQGEMMRPAYQQMNFAQWSAVREAFLRFCSA